MEFKTLTSCWVAVQDSTRALQTGKKATDILYLYISKLLRLLVVVDGC